MDGSSAYVPLTLKIAPIYSVINIVCVYLVFVKYPRPSSIFFYNRMTPNLSKSTPNIVLYQYNVLDDGTSGR